MGDMAVAFFDEKTIGAVVEYVIVFTNIAERYPT